jgi:hypothetical protein
MALEVTGRLHAKFPIQNIKENFSKREFVLELTEETASGMVFTNYASFQLVNNSCSVIDQFNEGEMLKVNFNIRGNRWERDGQVRYITNLNAWRVERAEQVNQAAPPQQSYGASQQAPSQPAYQAPAAGPAKDDDLPF